MRRQLITNSIKIIKFININKLFPNFAITMIKPLLTPTIHIKSLTDYQRFLKKRPRTAQLLKFSIIQKRPLQWELLNVVRILKTVPKIDDLSKSCSCKKSVCEGPRNCFVDQIFQILLLFKKLQLVAFMLQS